MQIRLINENMHLKLVKRYCLALKSMVYLQT